MTKFRDAQKQIIANAERRLELSAKMLLNYKLDCVDIILDNNPREQTLVLLQPTLEDLHTILVNFQQVIPEKYTVYRPSSITVHISDVIGLYINIFTVAGIFRLLIPDGYKLKAFKDLVIQEGNWSKESNRREPTGSWDYTLYLGGSTAYYPREDYTMELLMIHLAPLLIP